MSAEDIDRSSGYRYRCPSCLVEGGAARCDEHSPPGGYCVDIAHVAGCPYAGMPVDLLDRVPLN